MDAVNTTRTEVAPATIEQEVLAGFGHKVLRAVLKDGSLGAWMVQANPERCGKWGEIPEEDWEAAEEAAKAPAYTHPVVKPPTLRERGFKAGDWYPDGFGMVRLTEADLG